jgi:excinuclease ABC subunit C
VAVAGLAKENEWLFLPGQSEPVILAPTSKALLTVTHMRDETHRFAINYHRQVRKVAFKQSALDDAPGIGEGRKQSLLKHFGSLKRLTKASLLELEAAPGLGKKLARQLHDYLHGEPEPAA